MLQNQITFLQVAEDSLCTWLLVLPFVFPGLRERRGKCSCCLFGCDCESKRESRGGGERHSDIGNADWSRAGSSLFFSSLEPFEL